MPACSADMDDVATRRFFFRPAFAIYGGTAGFYTYGPPGAPSPPQSSSRGNMVWARGCL